MVPVFWYGKVVLLEAKLARQKVCETDWKALLSSAPTRM
jgi:hypothetical protein